VTSNGVKADLVREVLKDPPARNLKRLIYASSPDRGLETLLKIFSRVREHVGDAELHIFYGFDNIDKYLKLKQKWAIERFKGLKKAVMAASKQPGVTWHGRVSQIQLYREIASSALWVYPTDFTETSCITCMEMQSLGAIPITSDLWALADNVRHGVRLHGNPVADPLVRARYVGEIVKLLSVPDLQNHFRRPMMDWALTNFNWERWVDQWEHAIEGQTHRIWPTQFYYQHRQVQGRILNVGCGSDLTNFAGRGATNLDVREVGPDGTPNQAHVIHDVRDPWPQQLGTFDSVIIGDLLEHVTDEDAQTILEHAVKALRPDGRLVLTIPLDDYRPAEHQHLVGQGKLEDYAPGVSCYHRVLRTSEQVRAWFKTPWKIVDEREIDYGHFSGLGLTAVRV
jgi:SAM-dependent methyltransferase